MKTLFLHILLFLNGAAENVERYQEPIASADKIVCVDGGLRLFNKLNAGKMDYLVGDLDSIDPKYLNKIPTHKIIKKESPDLTDLEFALNFIQRKFLIKKITVIGATGGRFDQTIGNLLELRKAVRNSERGERTTLRYTQQKAKPCAAAHFSLRRGFGRQAGRTVYPEIKIITDNEDVFIVKNRIELKNMRGKTVSVLALGEAKGVTYTGMKWPLKDYDFPPNWTGAMSNTIVDDNASVSVREGDVFVFINH